MNIDSAKIVVLGMGAVFKMVIMVVTVVMMMGRSVFEEPADTRFTTKPTIATRWPGYS